MLVRLLGHLLDVLAIMRFALGAYEFDRFANLGFPDPGALHTNGTRLSHRQEQRIALSDQGLGACRIEDHARIRRRRGRECQARRDIRLNQAGNHIDRRTLGGEYQMHAGGASQLGDALDRAFDIVLRDHHEVCHLVDNHQQVRVWGNLAFRAGGGMHFAFHHGLVEVLHVTEAEKLEVVVAGVHLLDHPFQRLSGMLRIRDDRREQMRDAGVRGQFDALGVDENQAHLLRRGAHDDRHEHRIDKAGLT